MTQIDLDKFLKKAEENLNESLRHLEEGPTSLAQEFVELKLQACIFQYDICAEIAGVIRNQPKGFAASVSLKGLVLRLFEYDQVLNKRLLPRLLSLAKARGVPINTVEIRNLRTTWKTELATLHAWHDVRNQAAGHYGQDLQKQVQLLKSLELDSVMTVAEGFLSFNMGLLVYLRDAGRGLGKSTNE